MYVCVCACLFVCVCVCLCVCVCARACVCGYMYIAEPAPKEPGVKDGSKCQITTGKVKLLQDLPERTADAAHTCIYMHAYMMIAGLHVCIQACVYVCVHTYTGMHAIRAYTHTCLYIFIHTYMHAFIHFNTYMDPGI